MRAVADAQRGVGRRRSRRRPINKEAFRLAGLPWSGHTDLLAHLTGAPHVAMMFYSDALRVVLATVHIPLAEVPRALTRTSLEATIALTARELPRFGVARPRIAVAGPQSARRRARAVRPRRGDGDRARRSRRAARAASTCRARFRATRCSSAPRRGEFDVVVACYHDQGLIPVKLLAFGQAVNVTLGLPIVRTSVDHGTAFDIAGKGVADPESMIAAVLLAARLAHATRAVEPQSSRLSGLRSATRQTDDERPSASRRRRTSPKTARRSTTTTSSRRSRPASCCSAPR